VALVQRRIGAVFALFLLLLVLAAARTLYLATLQGGSLRQAARTQQLTYEPVPAQRGTISDRNGLDLAVSEPAQDISATPYLLRDPLSAAQRLAPLLGQPQDRLLRELTQRSGFVYLARAMPDARARAVLALKLPGVAGTPVMRRVYPRGALAAQVIGVVGTEGNGLEGLEYARNALLHGRSGERRVVRDAIGQPVSINEVHPESPGVSLSLTLDANIQQRAEEVLGTLGTSFGPRDATAIVMDPNSGAILAMANWPQVNANDPGGSSAGALENRAVGLDYEPGSTFKAITVAGALQQGLITPTTGFEVPGQIQVADRTIHDDTEHGVEPLTTAQILARSSNVGAIKIGFLEGAASFNGWVRRFGFGARTGIELPGEETGLVLPLSHYSGSSMGNLPIGQGQLVTPLQMASAYSAIANGGILRPPRIIGSVGDRPRPQAAGRRVISAATAAELRRMLEGVLAPGGTASQVSIPGYQLAGKTGTANKVEPATGQYSETAYVVSFLGFAPASDPKLLCAVIVDEPHSGSGVFGGTVAAPAVGQIMSFALPYLRIPPG
jgi:cell division protein FtsI (penicillin-binding protein 3)